MNFEFKFFICVPKVGFIPSEVLNIESKLQFKTKFKARFWTKAINTVYDYKDLLNIC